MACRDCIALGLRVIFERIEKVITTGK